MGSETDYGCYFSWGNTDGYNADEEYNFGNTNDGPYASTEGASVIEDISPTDAQHDAALACLGNPWHLPTKDDFQELYDNTDQEWATIDGINGLKFMNKNNSSVYIFLPAAGYIRDTNVNNISTLGGYCSSTIRTSGNVYGITFNSSFINPQAINARCFGFPVRAVRSSN